MDNVNLYDKKNATLWVHLLELAGYINHTNALYTTFVFDTP